MKSLKFAIVAISLAASSGPLAAQNRGYEGVQFVDAVRSGDGDKAMQLLQSSGPRIVDARDDKNDTALVVAIGNDDDRFTGHFRLVDIVRRKDNYWFVLFERA